MEFLREAPKASAFVPLVEHQSITPASFYTGPPVLHYYSNRCKLLVLEHDLSNAPALAALVQQSRTTVDSNGTAVNGEGLHAEDDEGITQKVVEDVDVWVTSEYEAFPPPSSPTDKRLANYCSSITLRRRA